MTDSSLVTWHSTAETNETGAKQFDMNSHVLHACTYIPNLPQILGFFWVFFFVFSNKLWLSVELNQNKFNVLEAGVLCFSSSLCQPVKHLTLKMDVVPNSYKCGHNIKSTKREIKQCQENRNQRNYIKELNALSRCDRTVAIPNEMKFSEGR